MNKNYSIILGLIVLGGVLSLSGYYFLAKPEAEKELVPGGQCETDKMIFYYTDWCPWCDKVKEEGTISKISQFGAEITEINVDKRTPQHQIRGIPAFIVGDSVYEGYRTFEELKELLGCEIF